MGHSAGDYLLKKVAEILKESLNPKDFLARLGGDEFTIIISNIKTDLEVLPTINRIIEKLSQAISVDGQSIYTTMSFGVAMYPSDGKDSESLLKKADTAMYRAKARGRNQLVFYDHFIEVKNLNRIKEEERLYNAIQKRSFILEYQPQVDVYSGEISGLEALIRIKTQDNKLLARWRTSAMGPHYATLKCTHFVHAHKLIAEGNRTYLNR